MPDTQQLQELPVHELACEIVQSFKIPEDDGAAAALSKADLVRWQKHLRAMQDDKMVFLHLAVVSLRLGKAGLNVAADQLMGLAKMGLNETQLEKTLGAADQLQRAAALTKQPRRQTNGLSSKAKTGVGLRSGNKKGRTGK